MVRSDAHVASDCHPVKAIYFYKQNTNLPDTYMPRGIASSSAKTTPTATFPPFPNAHALAYV